MKTNVLEKPEAKEAKGTVFPHHVTGKLFDVGPVLSELTEQADPIDSAVALDEAMEKILFWLQAEGQAPSQYDVNIYSTLRRLRTAILKGAGICDLLPNG